MDSNKVLAIVIGVVAVLLQLLLAPVIHIGSAYPSFPIIAVVLMVVLQPSQTHYGLAFAMGLAIDLLGHGMVGSSSIVLLVCAFALPYLVDAIGTDQLAMTVGLLFVGIFGSELVIGMLLAGGSDASLFQVLGGIVIPGIIYDLVLATIFFIVASRLLGDTTARHSSTSVSNLRFR